MAPILNDVATDLANPPEFVAKPNLNPLPADFKPQIFKAYQEELQALKLTCTAAQAYDACKAGTERMPRWHITSEDSTAGIIEGYAVTGLLRFRDDFVIRVRQDGEAARVDMRSKSRVGKGDLGANAKRIRSYLLDVSKNSGLAAEWVPLQEAK